MNSILDWILDNYQSEDIEIVERSEEAYSYLEDGESVLIFKNPFSEDFNLYVFFLKKRYTLIFGNWSCHYDKNLDGEKRLFYALDLILDKQAHVLSVNNDSFIMSCLAWQNRLFFSSDASARITSALLNKSFLESAAHGDLTISRLFWEQPLETITSPAVRIG